LKFYAGEDVIDQQSVISKLQEYSYDLTVNQGLYLLPLLALVGVAVTLLHPHSYYYYYYYYY